MDTKLKAEYVKLKGKKDKKDKEKTRLTELEGIKLGEENPTATQ